jgi:transcriptional regulator of acetoin/glycerol metabolism
VARRIATSSTAGEALGAEALEAALGAEAEADAPMDPRTSGSSGRDKAAVYQPEEIAALESALSTANGNLSRAASALGLTRAKAYRMLATLRRQSKS